MLTLVKSTRWSWILQSLYSSGGGDQCHQFTAVLVHMYRNNVAATRFGEEPLLLWRWTLLLSATRGPGFRCIQCHPVADHQTTMSDRIRWMQFWSVVSPALWQLNELKWVILTAGSSTSVGTRAMACIMAHCPLTDWHFMLHALYSTLLHQHPSDCWFMVENFPVYKHSFNKGNL